MWHGKNQDATNTIYSYAAIVPSRPRMRSFGFVSLPLHLSLCYLLNSALFPRISGTKHKLRTSASGSRAVLARFMRTDHGSKDPTRGASSGDWRCYIAHPPWSNEQLKCTVTDFGTSRVMSQWYRVIYTNDLDEEVSTRAAQTEIHEEIQA